MYDKLFKRLVFAEYLTKIGEALSVLVRIDVIIHENKNFFPMWTMYNKMFIKVRKNPDNYGTTKKNIKQLEKFCKKVITKVLTGKLLMSFISEL